MLSIQEVLLVLGQMLFVAAIPLLVWKYLNTNSKEERFWALVGFYVLYVILVCSMFTLVPWSVSNLVENGAIAAEAAQQYQVILNILIFTIPNVLGLICVIAWHWTKGRKEMSEMDRMKLEDM